jgi:hypothetical protein
VRETFEKNASNSREIGGRRVKGARLSVSERRAVRETFERNASNGREGRGQKETMGGEGGKKERHQP